MEGAYFIQSERAKNGRVPVADDDDDDDDDDQSGLSNNGP
jgi:hypothetical protein